MNAYTPRRQSARFLDGDCPAGVLAIFDDGPDTFDRYTVFYREFVPGSNGSQWIGYRGMSEDPYAPQGFGIYGEMQAWEVRAYRRAKYHRSARWSDLPEQVKRSVRQDCEAFA